MTNVFLHTDLIMICHRKHRRQSTQNDSKCGHNTEDKVHKMITNVVRKCQGCGADQRQCDGWLRANQNNLPFADSFNQINESHLKRFTV